MNINGTEIERKFLIKRYAPKIDGETVWDIVQTYLLRGEPDIQRRVRKITARGSTEYFYTEKKFVSDKVRRENERKIARDEYEALLKEEDRALRPIIKTRRIFDYKGQSFEMDEYPFSQELATVELELETAEQPVLLPDFLDVIKEVTGDKRYSNAAMAKAGRFPENVV